MNRSHGREGPTQGYELRRVARLCVCSPYTHAHTESRLLANLNDDDNELLVLRVPRDFDEKKLNGLQLDLKQSHFVASLQVDGADYRVHRVHGDATAHLVPLIANGDRSELAPVPVASMLEVIHYATQDPGARDRALQQLQPSKRARATQNVAAADAVASPRAVDSSRKSEKKAKKKKKAKKSKNDKEGSSSKKKHKK